jgi:hypothetical protein
LDIFKKSQAHCGGSHCNPSYLGDRYCEDYDSKIAQGKMLARSHLDKQVRHGGMHLSVFPAMQEAIGRKIVDQAWPGEKTQILSENNQSLTKRTQGHSSTGRAPD